ncbi:K02A2.6-like [Cordylochernes scorpioides]|uniref:K02A2.6-like n=1 Tax=Cordylochernes scorpioides TaxID=51811 RepID=A0ABY6KQP2_9ARAC|nr:K02A2.6-like [Cordylochernes scorpioides]
MGRLSIIPGHRAIEKELDELEVNRVITKIERSDWATSIVPIMKKNSKGQICGDFKITLNFVFKVDQYPLPKIEDIFAILRKGVKFRKSTYRMPIYSWNWMKIQEK